MSYNVRLFDNYEKGGGSTEQKIIEFIREQKPDILCLQEFYLSGDPVRKDNNITKALESYHSHTKLINNRRRGYMVLLLYPLSYNKKGEIFTEFFKSVNLQM